MTIPPRVVQVITYSSRNPLLEDIVRGLPAVGWEPVVVTLAPVGPLHASLRAAGIPALSLGWRGRLDHPRAAFRLARMMGDAAVVHGHVFEAVFSASIAAALTRTPLVVTRHEGPELVRRAPGRGVRRAVFHAIDRALVRRADAVIAPSAAVRRELAGMGLSPERTHLIPMGVDLSRIGAADRALARERRIELAPGSRFVGLVAGRLSWEKRFDLAIRAWALLVLDHPGARLLVAGDGPERATLERLVVERGVKDAVTFLGWRDDVCELMAASDVVIHPSAIESTGLVAIEALALGRPLIATPTGIVSEQLEHGIHCTVVPHGDHERLAAALRAVADAPAEFAAQAERGRDHVERVARIDSMLAAYADVYGLVAANGIADWAQRAASRART